MKHSSFLPICGAFAALLVCQHDYAHAEGGDKRPSGDWGVNRRVANEANGYTELQGTFSGLQLHIPVDEEGKVTSVTNPLNDKPTAYLGGNLGFEVDAGLQYEWKKVILTNVDVLDTADTKELKRGYAAFISRNGIFSNPRVAVPTPNDPTVLRWKPWRGYASSYTIHYKVWNGSQPFKVNGTTICTPVLGAVSVTLGGDFDGTFFWIKGAPGVGSATGLNTIDKPPVEYKKGGDDGLETPTAESTISAKYETKKAQPGVKIWPSEPTDSALYGALPLSKSFPAPKGVKDVGNVEKIIGKRVIGMTQGSKIEGVTDGAWFEGKFENGWITLSQQTPNEINGKGSGRPWQPSDVDQGAAEKTTGYDTRPNLPDGKDVAGKIDPNTPPAMDRTWFNIITPGAQYKTEFPQMGKAAREVGSENLKEDGKNRYAQETVRINLKNATRPWGYRVEPNESTP